MSDEKPAREPIQEDARIDALEARLKAAREREEQRNRPKVQGVDANYSSGNRALASLLGGIIGGLVIGFAVDALFDIAPWGLLAGLFLGTASAFRSIILSATTRPADPDQGSDSEV
ncbi:AtpZ/AtpI family protein [Porphyrobacter sp. ULC335]|jgi:ATP synthase protein I|uniref:AtpZ/AtpI family protein n=1 Tax=Porphyrobacter sp. ULC335 TaxID=2854260 RepID=UPI00221F62BD|nr:AtpZ/AtpI family protein [Porphyrobacter sp. ULC335]UYV15046.1 AtpZ/AtpI family protein [Porphyrobacter sp. ULC335]